MLIDMLIDMLMIFLIDMRYEQIDRCYKLQTYIYIPTHIPRHIVSCSYDEYLLLISDMCVCERDRERARASIYLSICCVCSIYMSIAAAAIS